MTPAEREMYRTGPIDHGLSRATPSAEQLEDRTRRLLAPRTITAELLGDPAPGQSALDKRPRK